MKVNQFAFFFLTFLLLVIGIVLIRNAWVCDDAYISFRSLDNFINGYGLTWNVAERVQSFTHPLWILFLSVFYFFTNEIYFTSIYISIVLCMVAVGWLGFRVSAGKSGAVIGLLLLLASKAWVDYAASGLENPLSYLLVVFFFYIYFKYPIKQETILLLSLYAALIMLNRMDHILLVAPVLVWVLWEYRKWRGFGIAALGFVPFFLWELFALIYYGFPFPNTAYAKLNTGISIIGYMEQGFAYFLNSISLDPITQIGMLIALLIPFFTKEKSDIPIALGIALYLLYVVRIGGDFMSGRFFAVPFLVAVISITRLPFPSMKSPWVVGIIGIILLISLSSPHPPLTSDADYRASKSWDNKGIADERGYYYPSTGLLNASRTVKMPNHGWAKAGVMERSNTMNLSRSAAVGFYGYHAGPEVFIMDYLALCDPLLARLPVVDPLRWRIGHFDRRVPNGYLESLETGENRIDDPDIAAYYDKLRLITRGPLFSAERFLAIIKMNLGMYSSLINESTYMRDPMLEVIIQDLSERKDNGTIWDEPGNLILSKSGIEVQLGKVRHDQFFDVSLDNNDEFDFLFMMDETIVGKKNFKSPSYARGGLVNSRIQVPPEVASQGYNAIRILPTGPDPKTSIGHLIFPKDELR